MDTLLSCVPACMGACTRARVNVCVYVYVCCIIIVISVLTCVEVYIIKLFAR